MKAIIYDLGDILYDAHRWRLWTYNVLRRRGCTWATFREYYEEYEAWLLPVYRGEQDYDGRFLAWLQRCSAEDLLGAAMRRKEHYERSRRLYAGVRRTLRLLAACGVANVVLTDSESPGHRIGEGLALRYGLDGCLHGVVSSRDVGRTKPAREAFFAALSRADCGVGDALFVGHDKDELDGARAIGLRCVEFNNYLGYSTEADFRIRRFSQLMRIARARW